jgi:hypothetical protein
VSTAILTEGLSITFAFALVAVWWRVAGATDGNGDHLGVDPDRCVGAPARLECDRRGAHRRTGRRRCVFARQACRPEPCATA